MEIFLLYVLLFFVSFFNDVTLLDHCEMANNFHSLPSSSSSDVKNYLPNFERILFTLNNERAFFCLNDKILSGALHILLAVNLENEPIFNKDSSKKSDLNSVGELSGPRFQGVNSETPEEVFGNFLALKESLNQLIGNKNGFFLPKNLRTQLPELFVLIEKDLLPTLEYFFAGASEWKESQKQVKIEKLEEKTRREGIDKELLVTPNKHLNNEQQWNSETIVKSPENEKRERRKKRHASPNSAAAYSLFVLLACTVRIASVFARVIKDSAAIAPAPNVGGGKANGHGGTVQIHTIIIILLFMSIGLILMAIERCVHRCRDVRRERQRIARIIREANESGREFQSERFIFNRARLLRSDEPIVLRPVVHSQQQHQPAVDITSDSMHSERKTPISDVECSTITTDNTEEIETGTPATVEIEEEQQQNECTICLSALEPSKSASFKGREMTFRGGFFFRNAGLMRTGATHYLNQLRVIVELPECNHFFHYGCLSRWLAEHDTCPNCRCDAEMPHFSDSELQSAQRPLKQALYNSTQRAQQIHTHTHPHIQSVLEEVKTFIQNLIHRPLAFPTDGRQGQQQQLELQ